MTELSEPVSEPEAGAATDRSGWVRQIAPSDAAGAPGVPDERQAAEEDDDGAGPLTEHPEGGGVHEGVGGQAALTVEAWTVRETQLRLDVLARTESVFALSNGHVGLRGNLEEGEPHGLPGTYLNSVYERRQLPYAEAGYGYPESGQTVIDVTNGKIIRLLVDDEPFDVRYGRLHRHERWLDLRAGTLNRVADWRSPADRMVRISTCRLVSLTHRSVAAIAYEVEPLDEPARVVLQSELVANEELPRPGADPRVAAVLEAPLEPVEHDAQGTRLTLLHRTRRSRIGVAVAADHVVEVPDGVDVRVSSEIRSDWGRVTVTAMLQPGERLRLLKFMSYGWSSLRSVPALRDQAAAGLTGAMHTGWEGLLTEQRQFLDTFWAGADVEVDGDPELQQAVRFALFHVLQSGVRAEERPIAAKGLTGPGYDGHCFWDTESFVLPVLMHTWPHAVADALRWRHATLPTARDRARQLGLRGAAFPWRTINGRECSGYWPAGTAAFHINADIADAVIRYHHTSGDEEFDREVGLDLLVETARLWASLGHFDANGDFRIDGVTGPDEYSALADNNTYTNLMAQRNLRAAVVAAGRHPVRAARLGVGGPEIARWRECADAITIPYDAVRGVHMQSEAFTHHQVWDFAGTRPEQYPLLLHFPYFDLYRKQVVKQADLVLAMHLRGDAFTAEQKAANFAYYEALTVRDSSLSACTQAVIAAEVGCLDLAYAYACEAAFMDLHDLESNTRDGLHTASLAGAWIAMVAGFGGMRDSGPLLSFAPRLPEQIRRLAFTLLQCGRRLRVETDGRTATYRLVDGEGTLDLLHYGEPVRVSGAGAVTLGIPPPPPAPMPIPPPGREPRRRKPPVEVGVRGTVRRP
ncbi:MAG TPA: glycosyl hydrolase family 65 protein [Kineosporiaceae bacterium]|nr:glycosyl hydrolase family 65 protein [Kineosporiaceae bacterium]